MKLNIVDLIALVLVIVGGINWGLVGLLQYNIVEAILGATTLAAIVYILVGLAAVYVAVISAKLERK